MSRTACSLSMLWMNKPVLGFFSTAGEAGLAAGLVDGVLVDGRSAEVLFQPGVVPLTFSGACVEGCVDGACLSELGATEGAALVVVVGG